MTSELPDLPLQHKAPEADFGVRFRRWWQRSHMPGTFELKHTRGKDALPFRSVEGDQVAFGLLAGSRDGILVRVSTGTVGASDYIGLIRSASWIVISYPRFFCVIALDGFLMERDRSPRKSLTSERAEAVATVVVRY